tara:strand:- start:634 stop:1308 length:675 start_codon:yes stop_codon:yes gene_type:complete
MLLPVFYFLFFIFFPVAQVSSYTTTIQHMEKMDMPLFRDKYYRKRPVVMRNTKKHFLNASKQIFSLCQEDTTSLARLPNMIGEETTMKGALMPCGPDCYGVHEKKLCKDFYNLIDFPFFDAEKDMLFLSLAKGSIETPAAYLEEDRCIYVSSGVQEYRLLMQYNGNIDLFASEIPYYADKIGSGDLLYVPKGTVLQHRSLTELSLAFLFPCTIKETITMEIDTA